MGGERASLAGLGCAPSPVCAHDPAAGPDEPWPCSSSSALSPLRLSPSSFFGSALFKEEIAFNETQMLLWGLAFLRGSLCPFASLG